MNVWTDSVKTISNVQVNTYDDTHRIISNTKQCAGNTNKLTALKKNTKQCAGDTNKLKALYQTLSNVQVIPTNSKHHIEH